MISTFRRRHHFRLKRSQKLFNPTAVVNRRSISFPCQAALYTTMKWENRLLLIFMLFFFSMGLHLTQLHRRLHLFPPCALCSLCVCLCARYRARYSSWRRCCRPPSFYVRTVYGWTARAVRPLVECRLSHSQHR